MNPSLLTQVLVAVLSCGLSFPVYGEDKLLSQLKERLAKEKSRLKTKPKPKAPETLTPMTWEQFLASNQGKGITRSELAKRFRVADANHDEILTPAEVEAHREAAAKNKSKKK